MLHISRGNAFTIYSAFSKIFSLSLFRFFFSLLFCVKSSKSDGGDAAALERDCGGWLCASWCRWWAGANCCAHLAAQSMLVKPAPLTVAGVYKALRDIAVTKGQGSAQRKQALMKQLLSRCRCPPP